MSTLSSLGVRFKDTLQNLVSRLGTERDKGYHSTYIFNPLTDDELLNAYRGAWLPRKIVDIPANDACRAWRSWQTEDDSVEQLEEEERKHNLVGKVHEAMIAARLFGGAAIYIGTGDSDPSLPLNPESKGKDSIKFLTVLNKVDLAPGDISQDPEVETFRQPEFYTLSSFANQMRIHPSRLVIFRGNRVPGGLVSGIEQGWGDSILQAIIDEVKKADAGSGNLSSLLFEAKTDVIRVPDLMSNMADEEYKNRLMERFTLAATAKGINGMLLLDKEEEWQQKTLTFNGLPDTVMTLLQIVSGAADIPVTRLLGQSPAGLNATGESDIRNYYDRISSMQEMDLDPAMMVLNEMLIRSALGKRDPSIYHSWRSLWQITKKEFAEIADKLATSIKTLDDTGLFPQEALANSAMAMLLENDILQGLDQEVEDAGGFDFPTPEEEAQQAASIAAIQAKALNPQPQKALPPPKTNDASIDDAAPRTLYISRKVVNSAAIRSWAKAQGFRNIKNDLHVTIAFSRVPVDWMRVGEAWSAELKINPGGPRMVDAMGPNGEIAALLFYSSELRYRHGRIIRSGASWDWPEYQPHISIGDFPLGNRDPFSIEPYQGEIILGPEIFEEIDPAKMDTPATKE